VLWHVGLVLQANKHFNKEAALREAQEAVKTQHSAYNKDDFFDMVGYIRFLYQSWLVQQHVPKSVTDSHCFDRQVPQELCQLLLGQLRAGVHSCKHRP
jgi:hypothetical protein